MEATDATVFDTLHRLFGVGDFTGDGDSEWFRWRAREIAKIKAYRTPRKVDPFQLVDAAQYCRRRGIWITAHWQLYEHLPAVDRERIADARKARVADLAAAIDDAIAIEAARPESEWLTRLIRAAGPARQEVYDAWLQWSSASRGSAEGASLSTASGAPHGGRS